MFRIRIALLCWLPAFACLAQEPADTNYDESKVPDYELPDALIDRAGNRVGRDQWVATRRAEILQMFEESVYGKTPNRRLSVVMNW